MNLLLIDTDIIIDFVRNDTIAVSYIEKEENNKTLALSIISVMELTIGCRNKNELKELKRFLTSFEIINLSEGVGQKARELIEKYYLSHHLLIPDAIIASSAISFNIPFVTKNRKDYSFIKELNLFSYK